MRDLIAAKPAQWFAVRDEKQFVARWSLAGDSLTRPPRGFAADHAAIEDLKRKDFVAICPLAFEEALGREAVKLAGERFARAAPFVGFLCEAVGVQY